MRRLGLPVETVAALIVSDKLPVDEPDVVPAVRPWFEHDVSGRKGSLPALMRLVRWPLLPAGMRQNLPNEPLFDHLITLDKESHSLGRRMMLECGARDSQGGVLAF